jgi:SHS2 domain-containing protein
MLSIAGDVENVSPREQYPLSAEGGDLESLLVNWLNEVLYWFDGRRIAFREFRIGRIGPERIEAVGSGQPRAHPARLIVKAATYHQLKVARSGDGWVAEVYLDI